MSERRRLSNADAAWLHMDRPTNLMVINSVLLFDVEVNPEGLRHTIQQRLVERYPRFSQRVVDSRLPLLAPSWEDDPNFALEHHIHHRALPTPGDDSELRELVGDLMATPLDRSKPLWSVYLVDGYGKGCAVIIRMHHCIADGIALARVMLSLTDTTRRAGIAAKPSPAPGDGASGRHGLLSVATGPLLDGVSLGLRAGRVAVEQGVDVVAHPGHLVKLAGAVGRDVSAAVELILTPADQASALKGDPGVSRLVSWTDPLPLERVKRIAHDHDATVNDVLLAAVSGALRHYLQDRGGPVPEIQALMPFNLRPLDEPVPRDLGNRFGLVFLPLPVATSGSYRRLLAVQQRMSAIKGSRAGPVSYGILGAVGMTPVAIESRIVDMLSGKSTAVMTNVPGPRKTVYLAGAPVRTVLVWAPTSGHVGMSVSIFSYRGEVTVGLMVDSKLVPEPARISEQLEIELRALAKIPATARPAAGAPRAHGGSPQNGAPHARVGQAQNKAPHAHTGQTQNKASHAHTGQVQNKAPHARVGQAKRNAPRARLTGHSSPST
jgi:WS/DGAT/MGAT family acyltransferase